MKWKKIMPDMAGKLLLQSVDEIFEAFKEYLEARMALLVIDLGSRSSGLLAKLIVKLALGLLLGFFILFLSFAFVFWYGRHFGEYYHGFLWVSLFYLILGIGVFVFAGKHIQQFINKEVINGINDSRELNNTLSGEDINTNADIIREAGYLKKRISTKESEIREHYGQLKNSLSIGKMFDDVSKKVITTHNISRIALISMRWLSRRKNK